MLLKLFLPLLDHRRLELRFFGTSGREEYERGIVRCLGKREMGNSTEEFGHEGLMIDRKGSRFRFGGCIFP